MKTEEMIILVAGCDDAFHRESLKEIAAGTGVELIFVDDIDFYQETHDRFVMSELEQIDLEFKIPATDATEPSLPYRDKKVMHPWSRRKKR